MKKNVNVNVNASTHVCQNSHTLAVPRYKVSTLYLALNGTLVLEVSNV